MATTDPVTGISFDEVLDLLISRKAVSSEEEVKNTPDSPQYRATSWIYLDPSYNNYSEDRIVQRWALAVFAFSWTGFGEELLQGWLTYTDECDWFTSSASISPCDAAGMYERIDIEDETLGGNLPSELSLLSDSLSKYQIAVAVLPRFLEEYAWGVSSQSC